MYIFCSVLKSDPKEPILPEPNGRTNVVVTGIKEVNRIVELL